MSGSINDSDRVFVHQFAKLIGGLAVLTVVLILAALAIYSHEPKETDPNVQAQVAARLAPAGAVYAGNTGRAAMQAAADAAPSGMVSILGLDRERVEALCQEAAQGEVLQLANFLCPGNIAVSGAYAACQRISQLAEAAGATKVVRLAVAGAFHTPLMQPAVERLTAALKNVTIQTPRLPVVANVDGQPHTDPDEIRDLLMRQIVSPVRWEESVRWLMGNGFDEFYEVGPGRVLRGLLKRIDRKVNAKGVE